MQEQPAAGEIDAKAKWYLDNRKMIIAAQHDAAKTHNQALLALAGGALGLSIAFIDELTPTQQVATDTWWIFAAWLLYIVALLATLASSLGNSETWRNELPLLDALYNDQDFSKFENRTSTATGWATRLALGAFILGTISLVMFVMLNL